MTSLVLTIVGARPNFMKAAPIHDAFVAAGAEHEIIHTGQHYDEAMSKVFFDDLGMPRPAVYLGVGSGSHAVQTANVMIGLEQVFIERRPSLVNVVGDVNSTMAAAIVAAKLCIPVAHTEAGLRSRDWTMPEEVNRAVTDAVSDLLLTPSADADENLLAEGRAPERIVRVGNVMIDTLLKHLEAATALRVFERYGLEPKGYAVLTLHRPSNVDDPATFSKLLEALLDIQGKIPIVFPIHPRTRLRLDTNPVAERFKKAQNIRLIEPQGYLQFLSLSAHARFVLTDSGGLQEESTALDIPCLTLRENTERPITVDSGTNTIVGTDPDQIRQAAAEILAGRGKTGRVPELWDGKAGVRIFEAITRFLATRTRTSPR
ncbi:MAG: UDP-N-acetylglucosamine 2-epimerase (non-hydrolyzing) [Deltaproteobacteria bacterium]|nr:UDP-N-acetylglucosamine 2-epimerase (non-hydrolyzing) [Deltaproteobacteria bacterium]